MRLGLSTDHFGGVRPEPTSKLVTACAGASHLRDAGSLFAATWFTLRGARASWPLEPCRYDLLVDIGGSVHRIQVKTTGGVSGAAMVLLSNSRRRGRAVYGPDEIDWLFVLDRELTAYLIPYDVVAGLGTLKLSHYAAFVVADKGDLLSAASCPAPEPKSRSGFP